jgi:hypothetical protein
MSRAYAVADAREEVELQQVDLRLHITLGHARVS